MRRNGIRKEAHRGRDHALDNPISLAVWDVPMPVVAGEMFSIKVGAKSASGRSLAGCRVEVSDAAGAVVASGNARRSAVGRNRGAVLDRDRRAGAGDGASGRIRRAVHPGPRVTTRRRRGSASRSTAKPEHKLTVKVTEQNTAAALGGVEIRLGPFHARTDAAGHAELRVCKGEYQLHLWRTAHIAQPQPIRIDGDVSVELTMVHVPEEHPDARWVTDH